MHTDKGVLIVATMDTKGKEVAYLMDCFREIGVPVVTLDAGIMGEALFPATVSRHQIAEAGGMSLEEVRTIGHEGKALSVMVNGAVEWARTLYGQGIIGGIIGIGGSMGTTLGTSVMRSFPIGFPKVMVSTMASRNVRPFIGTKDIFMLHSVCDLSGINRITGQVLRNGALAVAGMLSEKAPYVAADKPVITLSTLGTTEACAQKVRQALEEKGREVIVFHTVGAGGQAMEEMVAEGRVEAVVDLSLHEIMDHYFGGDYDAGPDRGRAALQKGVPTVLVPGNIDFLVTGPLRSAEVHFPGRLFHAHNAVITCIRTRKREVEKAASLLAHYCNESRGPIRVLIPEAGFSAFDRKGGPFYDPEAVRVFTKTLKSEMSARIPLSILPFHINDPGFSSAIIEAMEQIL